MSKNEKNNLENCCCPKFDPTPWEEKTLEWKDRLFIKADVFNIFHVPVNMGSVITKAWNKIIEMKAMPDDFIILSYEASPWKSEQYISVKKEVPGYENVKFSGTFITRVFEGPYNYVPKWCKEMDEFITKKEMQIKKLYFYYTTCPKCAKAYGKNYIVAVAQIEQQQKL